jgi:hypothetical protein
MNDRRRYEGEDGLQLQLLDVTQDPTFGTQPPQCKMVLFDYGNGDVGQSEESGPNVSGMAH